MATPAVRKYRHFERPWLAEYLAARYQHVRFEFEKPVILPGNSSLVTPGSYVSPAYGGVKVARLDAYKLWSDHQTIWEARRNPQVGLIETVARYERFWQASALGIKNSALPIHMHILVDRPAPLLEQEAKALGFEWVVYLPSWLAKEEADAAAKEAASLAAASRRRRGLA